MGVVIRLHVGRMRNYGLFPRMDKRHVSSMKCPYRLCGPNGFLPGGYRVLFPGIQEAGLKADS